MYGKRYSPACTRLLSQYKTMLKLLGDAVPSLEEFMARYRVRACCCALPECGSDLWEVLIFGLQMDHPAALHRLKVGVPATVEHSSEAGPETGKWVAETTQVRPSSHSFSSHLLSSSSSFSLLSAWLILFLQSFITFMDALKLRLRAKDQLHPILQELVTGYARFKGSKEWEGRSRMVSWYVPLLYKSFHLRSC